MNAILQARLRHLIALGLKRQGCPFCEAPDRMLVADIAYQKLHWMVNGEIRQSFPISSALNGLGSEDGSYKTPLGWHAVHARIGEGAPTGMVFKARVATGEVWQGQTQKEDLITTRILTLNGLEPCFNQGPGIDSLQRFIYIHGTNHEEGLGQPLSKGCLRMANFDILELFEAVQEGDPLLVVNEPKQALGALHFVGVAGSGMSALAQFAASDSISGSDRAFDRSQQPERRAQLENLGVRITPQDGSGISPECTGVVYSTAVEETVPDFAKAKELGLPLLHRSELLAFWVETMPTIAITGTSGKSTTTAMVFEILHRAGYAPSLITGGELRLLQEMGLWGNAYQSTSPGKSILVIEADESDGSVVRYKPSIGVILNLQKDHKEESIVMEMFRSFKGNIKDRLVLTDQANLAELQNGALTFGFSEKAHICGQEIELRPDRSSFLIDNTRFSLPIPGRHNIENALAAIAACQAYGLELAEMVEPLSRFKGVARRFQVVGETRGITVVDDFGHNPAKVAASIQTAKNRAARVLAVYQPHGYGPTRFLWHDFVESFSTHLGPQDQLHMLEVFYAGGTATRDFSAADLVKDIAAKGTNAHFAQSREALIGTLAKIAQGGDLILLMGARDPSLSQLARDIFQAVQKKA